MNDPSAVRLFSTMPGDDLRVEFQEFHKKTNAPEDFPGLCRSPPAADWEFEIVDQFAIKRAARTGGEMIPCAVCCPKEGKFLEGVLTWDRTDHVLRIIGNACGSDHTQKRRDDALERFRRDRRQKEINRELSLFLPLVPQYLARARSIQNAATYASELRDKVRAAKTFIHRVLDDVNVHNNSYTWEESFIDPLGKPQSVRRAVPAAGLKVLRQGYSPAGHVEKALVGFVRIGVSSQDAARQWLLDHALRAAEREACHQTLMSAVKALDTAEQEIAEAYAFFNDANIKLLQGWTRRRADLGVQCSTGATDYVFIGPPLNGAKMEAHVRVNDWRLKLSKREAAIRAA